jgi:ketosteroid isomerase-like protein
VRAIILVAALMVSASYASADQKRGRDAASKAGVEQHVLEAMRLYEEATGHNDVAALNNILADDFVFTSSRGAVVTKAQELSDIRSGQMKAQSAAIDDVTVRPRSNMAVVTGRVRLSGVWRGQDFTGSYRVTATWVKEFGLWRLLAIHSSRQQ